MLGSGWAKAGAASTQAAAFNVSHDGAPGNYLVVVAVNESGVVGNIQFEGQPMQLLYRAELETASVDYYGIETSTTAGAVSVNYSSVIWGSQIFGYAFLAGVNTVEPVRAEASAGAARDAGTGSLSLHLDQDAVAGDLALLAAYKDDTGQAIATAAALTALINESAGASFTGGIFLQNDLPEGAYAAEVTFGVNTNRELAAAVVLAAAPAPQGALDADGDGFPADVEHFLGTSDTLVADVLSRISYKLLTTAQGTKLEFHYSESTDSQRPAGRVLWSSDLLEWKATGLTVEVVEPHEGYNLVKATLINPDGFVFFMIEVD